MSACSSAPAPAAPAVPVRHAIPVKQTKPRRGDGRPHANPHNAERCEAEIVSFGPLEPPSSSNSETGAGEGLVLQKELQYLRESRRGAGAEMGRWCRLRGAVADRRGQVRRLPAAALGRRKNRDAAALILAG